MLTVNKNGPKPIHFTSKVCQQIRFGYFLGLGTPLFGFGTLTKIRNMSTLTWHKTCNITHNRYISLLFHRQRVNLHTKYMVSLSLHLLGERITLLKRRTFQKNMKFLEKHFTFFISHQLTLKQNGGGWQKSQCRHVSTETYS